MPKKNAYSCFVTDYIKEVKDKTGRTLSIVSFMLWTFSKYDFYNKIFFLFIVLERGVCWGIGILEGKIWILINFRMKSNKIPQTIINWQNRHWLIARKPTTGKRPATLEPALKPAIAERAPALHGHEPISHFEQAKVFWFPRSSVASKKRKWKWKRWRNASWRYLSIFQSCLVK